MLSLKRNVSNGTLRKKIKVIKWVQEFTYHDSKWEQKEKLKYLVYFIIVGRRFKRSRKRKVMQDDCANRIVWVFLKFIKEFAAVNN